MTSAAQHLANYGVSMAQAQSFVMSNLDNPQVILSVASDFGITNAMLGEIAGGYSAADVEAFFLFYGLDSSGLDPVVTQPDFTPGGGLGLFPDEWLGLASSVLALNNESGILSNSAIRSQVLTFSGIAEADYLAALSPANWADDVVLADGVFSPEELGFSHLGSLTATAETVESLIYGSIIKVVRSIDEGEMMALENFFASNELSLDYMDPGVTDELIDLMVNVLSTPANPPLVSDAELSQGLAFAAVALVGVLESGAFPSIDDFF